MSLVIQNHGQAIVEANYWTSEYFQKGYHYLSWNARAARLLLAAISPCLSRPCIGFVSKSERFS